MKREYHKWYSKDLGREMELLHFGHDGAPMLFFPTSLGKYFEYEDRQMVATVADRIEAGHLQITCVDSVDAESWYNKHAHPYWRVQRHLQYERYIMNDVVPFMHERSRAHRFITTGCSFGAYHAMNFGLKHPDLVTDVVTMGGSFDIRQFMDGWSSDDVYFNNPPDYLYHMGDPWYLDRYRQMRIVMATGEHDHRWDENERLAGIMRMRSIPHQLYVWGDNTGHDWPWWLKMARWYIQ